MKPIRHINSATLFGLGYIKYAPGTFGSLLPLLFLLIDGSAFYIALISVNLVLVLKSFGEIAIIENMGENDPSFVVVDEFLGMSLILLIPFLPKTIFWGIISFGIFRFFDIFKPFPINLLNAKAGPFFVFADDVMAALFSIIIIYLTYMSSQVLAIILL